MRIGLTASPLSFYRVVVFSNPLAANSRFIPHSGLKSYKGDIQWLIKSSSSTLVDGR